MMNKIRAPRLRSFFLGIVILSAFLLFVVHRDARREISNSKTTGLGAVAADWDPISLWKQDSFRRKTKKGIIGGIIGGVPGGTNNASIRPASMTVYLESPQQADQTSESRKVIRTVGLELLVRNSRESASKIEQLTYATRGEVEKAELRNYAETSQTGTLTIRVPSEQLDNVVASLRKLALRVQIEHWESRDISREYMDNEARLRNMKAEEQQYLVLLRRSGSMKDTLEVTEKISEVRGEIEQLQGELNWWSHQVAMSAIQISLTEEPQATLAAHWRPLYNAKNAAHEMLLGLGEWFDWAITFVIDLPLILLWVCSVGGLLWAVWKILRWVWLRWWKPSSPPQPAAT